MNWIKSLLWSVFGNDEEPTPPGWYLPGKGEKYRYWMWLLYRNPLHNFSWHVIGFAGEPGYQKKGDFPAHVWNPGGGWNYIVHYKTNPFYGYPFYSYRGEWVEFYIGWREKGNFGASVRRANS